MKVAYLSLCVYLLLYIPVSESQKGSGSCINDLNLQKDGSCCSESICCTDGGCCCDQSCYSFGDCCQDVWKQDCVPLEGQPTLAPPACADFGYTDGCCMTDCRVEEELCYCDSDCYQNGDCCFDIQTIGCECNITCKENFPEILGCCEGANCNTSCCSCDNECHSRGDCCIDIIEFGCLATDPPTVCPAVTSQHDDSTLFWNTTVAGVTVYLPCPPPREGIVYRQCMANGEWSETDSVQCILAELEVINSQLLDIVARNGTLSPEEENIFVSNITQSLTDITNASDAQEYASDISKINDIITDSITVITRNVGNKNISLPFLETGMLDVFNILLEERYNKTYEKIGESRSGSTRLINNIEEYGNYAGQFIVTYEETEIPKKQNLAVKVDIPNMDTKENIVFPITGDLNKFEDDDSDAKIIIPYDLLDEIANSGSTVAVVSSLINNIGDFLPNTLQNSTTRVGTQVISSQLVSETQSFKVAVTLNFTTKSFGENLVQSNPFCAFWNYTINGGLGGWSSEGIEIVYNTTINQSGNARHVITCESTHLTPFSVLVDVNGLETNNPTEELALNIVTYIGLSISIVCLILTIIFLLLLGKDVVKGTQYFIHLNLSIALLIANVVFLLFIDGQLFNVTNSKVGCAIVAGLLHYFYLAVFSWMLCEGILLFLLLVIVFSALSKRWYVFLIIGWGLPVIPVAVSAGIIHEQYGIKGRYCWIDATQRGALWAFVGPILIIILINIFFLVMCVRALILYQRRKAKEHGEKKSGFKIFKKTVLGTVTLLPLIGVTWAIGLLAVNQSTTVFAWLFTIFSTLQGAFIFVFNIIRNDKIKENVMKKCCPKLYKKRRTIKKSGSMSERKRSSTYLKDTRSRPTMLSMSDEPVNYDDQPIIAIDTKPGIVHY